MRNIVKQDDPIKNVVRNFRRALNYKGLYEREAPAEPIELFKKWMAAAVKKELFEPNAMTLATATQDGRPTARTVLLKDFGPDGFVFYTNYHSRKGKNLEANPHASLVFYWGSLSRQVLVDGTVTRTDRRTSEEYFHSRPRGSQIAAAASEQSSVVSNRETLMDKMKEIERDYQGKEVPCPQNWGGYCLIPQRIEFWQGRPDRMHDRLCYQLQADGTWLRERLAP
ncbi:MAG: pyridoxamine 5'-phosphate oxidase [Candidatus Omnitrophica bacterium]|nr:pyridoxamine 5'-phosphate oxidase [Candidatus Omnitrophota bacterium]